MEQLQKPQELYIRRKRWVEVLELIIIFLCFAMFAIVLALSFMGVIEYETAAQRVFVYIGSILFAAYALASVCLLIRNVINPLVLRADDDGLYDYTGFFPCGFVRWDEIASIESGKKSRAEAVLDALNNEGMTIRLYLKDKKQFLKGKSFLVKAAIFFGAGAVCIRTGASTVKNARLRELIAERLTYFRSDTAQEV